MHHGFTELCACSPESPIAKQLLHLYLYVNTHTSYSNSFCRTRGILHVRDQTRNHEHLDYNKKKPSQLQ
jgi:hypothetical protein